MTKTRLILLSSLLGSMALVTGCRTLAGNSCLKPPNAKDSQDNPPLRIPVGLDAPDTRAALKIPALDEPAAPPVASRCLEDPPLIAPLADPAADKGSKAAEKPKRSAKRRPPGPPGKSAP